MTIKSEFTSLIYVPFLLLIVMGFIFGINLIIGQDTFPKPFLIMIIAGAVWVFSLIFLYEVRLKIIKAELNSREVIIRKILGLGPEKKYRLKDLQGFHTYTRRINRKSGFNTEVVEYNFIHLMHNDRIVGRISSQYHKNYNEMADFIKEHLTDLGYKKPGIRSEIKATLGF